MVRVLTDKLGIKTKRSEERRDREAMSIALTEYQAEEEAKIRFTIAERERQETIHKAELERRIAIQKAEQDQIILEREMLQARANLDYMIHNRFERQRAQEIVERDLNSRLLTVDDLEAEVLSENPGIEGRVIAFEGTNIPVYDLKGIPFAILSTTIDFKRLNEGVSGDMFKIGLETYKKVMDNPAIWAERRDEAEKDNGFGTEGSYARGDTICTSYWNSERNINSHVSGDLIYGFEYVMADSIISIHYGDGATGNMAGRVETDLSYNSLDSIKNIESAGKSSPYNEILLRRYSENGVPKKPDYIIVENGKITEVTLRHAKYFSIPIVNVERDVYLEKSEREGT